MELADSTRFELAFHRLTVGCFPISYEPKNFLYEKSQIPNPTSQIVLVGNAARENCSERTKDKCVHCEQKTGFIFSILLSSQNPRAAFFVVSFLSTRIEDCIGTARIELAILR
jgi:hypothetical protein